MNKPDQYRLVAEAFSRQSSHYDQDDQSNEILRIMRKQVRGEVEKIIDPGTHILELNAGTGLDAVYFAKRAYKVTATDLSTGMIEQIEQKIEVHKLHGQLNAVQAGFHELRAKVEGKYEFIFSNMGGLNCEKDLSKVFEELSPLAKPRAKALLVVMPKHCPSEWLSILKGKWKHAFRRYRSNGTKAHLDGVHFTTYYHSYKDIQNALPKDWKLIKSTGLGATIPQPHSHHFPDRYPGIFKILKSIDRRLRSYYPFNRWADHLMIEIKYNPA